MRGSHARGSIWDPGGRGAAFLGCLLALLVTSPISGQQQPYLVEDIHPTSSSDPTELVGSGGTLFFWARGGVGATGIYRTTGEPGTTQLILVPTTYPDYMLGAGASIYLSTGRGWTIWDHLGPIYTRGPGETLSEVGAELHGGLFFGLTTHTPSTDIQEPDTCRLYLMSTGGTGIQTVWQIREDFGWPLPARDCPQIGEMFSAIDLVFFDGSATNGASVWPMSIGGPSSWAEMGGMLYYSAPGRLRRTDGRSGSSTVKQIGPLGSGEPDELTAVGDLLFFTAVESNTGRELWMSDGTGAGTVLVKDILPGTTGSSPRWLTAVGPILYFAAADGLTGYELWRSDGTQAGTYLVADLLPGGFSSDPQELAAAGQLVYFSADDRVNGRELWVSDGTEAGTVLVADLYTGPGSSGPANFHLSGNRLFFTAQDDTHGRELWAIDVDRDLDTVIDEEDNCPDLPNPGQEDLDGDGFGDDCDCGPADPEAWDSVPEVRGLQVERLVDRQVRLSWDPIVPRAGLTASYDVVIGMIADLGQDSFRPLGRMWCAGNQLSDETLELDHSLSRWYLVAGYLEPASECGEGTFGDSTLDPDPRDLPDTGIVCP
jgi:ELWxxDGT repeat protein